MTDCIWKKFSLDKYPVGTGSTEDSLIYKCKNICPGFDDSCPYKALVQEKKHETDRS